MTAKQMEMYMNGTTGKMVQEVKEYEAEQFNKAFEIGTDKAWKTYRRNVMRKVSELNKVTGIGMDTNKLMAL